MPGFVEWRRGPPSGDPKRKSCGPALADGMEDTEMVSMEGRQTVNVIVVLLIYGKIKKTKIEQNIIK